MQNTTTKVSDVTVEDLASYLRLPELTESDTKQLGTMLESAKAFMRSYTGQTDLDVHPDFVTVLYVLCQDAWDHRSLYVDKSNLNNVVETTLGMHSINLVPEAGNA